MNCQEKYKKYKLKYLEAKKAQLTHQIALISNKSQQLAQPTPLEYKSKQGDLTKAANLKKKFDQLISDFSSDQRDIKLLTQHVDILQQLKIPDQPAGNTTVYQGNQIVTNNLGKIPKLAATFAKQIIPTVRQMVVENGLISSQVAQEIYPAI